MVCSFCGSTLEDNERECPYCGHKVGNSADSMNDDMARKFAARQEFDDDDDYDEQPIRSRAKKISRPSLSKSRPAQESYSAPVQRSSSGGSGKGNILLLGAAGICALLSLICLISVAGVKSQVKDMYQDMLSQFYQLQSSNSQLANQLQAIDSSVVGVGQTVNESKESALIVIDTQPTSVNTTVGRAEYARVFSIEATGNVEAITWQKKDNASGEWVDLVFDFNTSINDEFGLQLYDNHYKGESVLYAVGLTEKAEGTYRAKLTDSYNTAKYSDPVTLAFKTVEVTEGEEA